MVDDDDDDGEEDEDDDGPPFEEGEEGLDGDCDFIA